MTELEACEHFLTMLIGEGALKAKRAGKEPVLPTPTEEVYFKAGFHAGAQWVRDYQAAAEEGAK